ERIALMEQPGVLVWLSTKRPRVQIPLGALTGRYANRQSGQAQTLVNRLWVQLPPVLLCRCVGWALASPSGCNPPAIAVQVQLLPDALIGPFVYRFEDTTFSQWKEGFNSPTGY